MFLQAINLSRLEQDIHNGTIVSGLLALEASRSDKTAHVQNYE